MTNQDAIDFVYRITQKNFEVMPLSGKDGKKPRVSRFKDRTIHHRGTIRLLEADEISTYGIRLRRLTVIEIDEGIGVCRGSRVPTGQVKFHCRNWTRLSSLLLW